LNLLTRSPEAVGPIAGRRLLFCAAIMASEPLARFLAENVDPVDEMKPAERSRREAWAKISEQADDRLTAESVGRAFPINFLAMHFLMAHEVAHLAGGHLPLFAGAFTAEADGTGRPNKAENRVLERDADVLALLLEVALQSARGESADAGNSEEAVCAVPVVPVRVRVRRAGTFRIWPLWRALP
jgi:hypothetical protein